MVFGAEICFLQSGEHDERAHATKEAGSEQVCAANTIHEGHANEGGDHHDAVPSR